VPLQVREDVELAAEAHAHACKVPLLPSEDILATASPEEQQQAVAALPPCPPVDLQVGVGVHTQQWCWTVFQAALLAHTTQSAPSPLHLR